MNERGVLVDAGRLRVDRGRALDKLMQFQLPDPHMYALPWIRAAVLGGAARIEVAADDDGLAVGFDGRNIDPDVLADPYAHLFDEESAQARLRELAIGLLAALRLRPSRLTLHFWSGGAWHELSVHSPTSETLRSPAKPPPGALSARGLTTVLRVGLRGGRERVVDHIFERARHCPVPILRAGRRCNNGFAQSAALITRSFQRPRASGALLIDRRPRGSSPIDFVRAGVTVETKHLRLPGLQALGVVHGDALRTSLSQTGLIQDDAFDEAAAALGDASRALLGDAVALAKESAPAAMRALKNNGAWAAWMPWSGQCLIHALSYNLGVSPADGTAVGNLSVIISLLRQACLIHRSDMIRGESPEYAALWRAPTLFDSHGEPLDLRTLDLQARWLKQVPYVRGRPTAAVDTLTAAWIISKADLDFLEAFFPTLPAPHREAPTGRLPDSRPVIRESNMLVRRSFQSGLICGEVGLSLTPRRAMARFLWVNERRVLGRSQWDLGGLRLDAAVYHPQLKTVPAPGGTSDAGAQCAAAVMNAAGPLYYALARDYRAEEKTPLQMLRREHLLDFLGAVYDRAARRCPRCPWLEELALFRSLTGSPLSLADIRRAAASGPVRLAASPHPPRLRALAVGYPDHVTRLFGGDAAVAITAPKKPARPAPRAAPKPAPPRPLPAPRPEPEPPLEPAPRVESLLLDAAEEARRWLEELKRRADPPFPDGQVPELRLGSSSSKRLLVPSPRGGWILNRRSPLYRAFDSIGGPIHGLPYLVSLLYSGLNLARRDISDAADIRFQLALARLCARGYE